MLIKQNMEAAGLPAPMAASVFEGFLANPQNWNAYAYVRNNPLRFVDPSGEAPNGHHLIINRDMLENPLAQDFAERIKTGPLSGDGYPNQPGFQKIHEAYNEAVEEVMTNAESVEGERNSWSIGQWQRVANQILNSSDFRIKDFLDELEANNPGAKSALFTAVSAYRASASVVAELVAWTVASRISGFTLFLTVGADQAVKQGKKLHPDCLLDRTTHACIL